jgi:hypothetical protein
MKIRLRENRRLRTVKEKVYRAEKVRQNLVRQVTVEKSGQDVRDEYSKEEQDNQYSSKVNPAK